MVTSSAPKMVNSVFGWTRPGQPTAPAGVDADASEIAIDAPIAVIRKASGGALRLRSGRYATRSTARAVDAEATAATIMPTNR